MRKNMGSGSGDGKVGAKNKWGRSTVLLHSCCVTENNECIAYERPGGRSGGAEVWILPQFPNHVRP